MKKFLVMLAASLAVVACSEKDKKNVQQAIDKTKGNVEEAADDTGLQAKAFQSECAAEPLDAITTTLFTLGKASVKSSRIEYKFEGANVTRKTSMYAELGCAGEAYSFEEVGRFNILKDQRTNDGGTFIDINWEKLTVKMDSAVGVTAANGTSLCGITDWAEGNEGRDVSAKANDPTCYGAQIPRTSLNVYRVDAEKILLFGSPDQENNQRPSQLNNTKYTAK